ncbi:ABC transporter ATP-binding protein [Pseudonocardia sp. MH-G8]|uniref:ABC transporter ATP-binding protein n=1 Tax=Pseudonocardia sp. MH-G8 TaxID=1854588 RepID=UPI000BA028C9|nr:ABC transporter ATP-binding protein [Pseudonocardia sp. MH-G8]OZM82150.1 dipeptide/oligopeptide/nickel ABC transporter ATP-binding protein [Pseudonocardia sp. MH-G8]
MTTAAGETRTDGARVGAEPLLSVRDLRVSFPRKGEPETVAVDGVSFDVAPGQVVGLVGESGCGKSVTSMAIMRLLPERGVRVSGSVMMDGTDLLTLPSSQMRERRGRDMSMVFQDPLTSLNPVIPIGLQVTEVLRRHRGMNKEAARKAAVELLDRVGIPDPRRRLDSYPHQLSGGMRQRALIAIALACSPRLLIADEPTTALDVTIQAQILELLRELVRETGAALIMITHDLGVVAGLCETVNVLYAGRIVERAQRHRLFSTPRHPYTHGLLRSIPRLDAPQGEELEAIRGSVVDNLPWEHACAFAPRCPRALDTCAEVTPLGETTGGRLLRCHNPVPASAE